MGPGEVMVNNSDTIRIPWISVRGTDIGEDLVFVKHLLGCLGGPLSRAVTKPSSVIDIPVAEIHPR